MSETVTEVLTIAEQLRAARDVLPWVIFVVVGIVLWKSRHHITNWIQASIDEKKEQTVYHAQQNELIRNNTAALQNNTAALEMVQRDRETTIMRIDQHEKMSEERFTHLQAVVNQTRDTVLENSKSIAVVGEKVKN